MRITVNLSLVTALVLALLTLAVPAEAKPRVTLTTSASENGVLATATLKRAGDVTLKVTLQRKDGKRWLAVASGTPKRGQVALRWTSGFKPGGAYRLRVVVSRGRRTVAVSASRLVRIPSTAVSEPEPNVIPTPTPTPAPAPKPAPKPVPIDGSGIHDGSGDLSNDVLDLTPLWGRQVSVSSREACAINDAREVRCWPSNARFDAVVPAKVAGLPNAYVLAAGASHTCAATESGRVLCWGDNSAMQLGDRTATGAATQVPTISGIASLVAGADLTCVNYRSPARPPICWGTTAVRPAKVPTGTLARPSNIGLGAEWTIDSINATRICGHTPAAGTCFGVGGSQAPHVAPDLDRTATGATSSCSVVDFGVQCVGTAPTSTVPSDDLVSPTLLPGTGPIEQLATNGTTYCGWSSQSAPMCWGAPAQGGATVWTALAVNGFNR